MNVHDHKQVLFQQVPCGAAAVKYHSGERSEQVFDWPQCMPLNANMVRCSRAAADNVAYLQTFDTAKQLNGLLWEAVTIIVVAFELTVLSTSRTADNVPGCLCCCF